MLAVFSNACNSSSDSSSSSSGDSSPSSDPPKDQKKVESPSQKPQVSVSSCSIKEFQDETGKTQAIVAGKGQDIEKDQTLTLFYDCNIAKKDYNKQAILAVSGNTAITTSVTEIKLPAQDKATGSFTVKGLKTADTNVQTSIKIELEKSDVLTELALTVTPTFVLDKDKVKIAEIATTGLTTVNNNNLKKLAVYQNKLYLLNSAGGANNVKFYSSSDGKTWTELATPQDATDSSKKIRGHNFDTAVHDDKLWVVGTYRGLDDVVWNFDGKDWKQLSQNAGDMDKRGSVVRFKNTLYQIAALTTRAENKIWMYDLPNWKIKHDFSDYLGYIDTVVFDGKIWIVGGLENEDKSDQKELNTVATFDGTTYDKDFANLPNSKAIWWIAMEVFPRGLLAIGGYTNKILPIAENWVFWSRWGKTWTEITGINDQNKFRGVNSGSTVVWKDALWAFSVTNKKLLKITYEE